MVTDLVTWFADHRETLDLMGASGHWSAMTVFCVGLIPTTLRVREVFSEVTLTVTLSFLMVEVMEPYDIDN